MITISPTIRKAKPNADGTYNIKIAIRTNGTEAYMATKYNIESSNQFVGGRVVRHSNAKFLNVKISELLDQYDEIIEPLENFDLSAKEVKSYIEKESNKVATLDKYGSLFLDNLRANGQSSYAKNMEYTLRYLTECFGGKMLLERFSLNAIKQFESFLLKRGDSPTTINIRMTHLKALLNAAVNEGLVEYKIFPFRNYKMPKKNVRDICISREELAKLRDCDPATFPKPKFTTANTARRLTIAKDLFMLSFYCAGINLTDLIDANVSGDVLTFVRKKTANKKQGEKEVSITIQPEARAIIDKYIQPDGRMDFGYHFSDYGQFRSFVTNSLNRIGETLGFEKRLMFYSARKTFVQFGAELGIPLYILEYAIGQTIKEANNRPVFNYLKVMRQQADLAIRTIIDYSLEPDTEENAPLPEWARRR